MKKVIGVIALFFLAGVTLGQTWSGSTPGNIYYNGGRVGIGRSDPYNLLHVHNPTVPANNVGGTEEIANLSGLAGNHSQFIFLLRRHSLIGSFGGGWNDIGSRLQFRTDVSNQGYLEFNPQGGLYGLAIGSTQGEIMRFNQNGNVGIGTTNPEMLLEVRKDQATTTRMGVRNSSNGAGAAARYDLSTYTPNSYALSELVENGGNPYYFFGVGIGVKAAYYDAPEFNFRNMSGITSLKIATTGNVGIGTSNISDASYKLFVETGIRTRKIKVDQTTWADYVFKPDYKLLKLSQVEAFIKQYGHLPEVPSGKEVAANGTDLGDTQVLLLKKIEELTLYVIELSKENEAIKAELKTINRNK